jgi:glycerol-3-phosphate cytidylyltransferase
MKYKVAMCFCTADPLHFGHIRLFKRASKIAERVYACTESDEIIRETKNREPFTSENKRVEDLEGIKYLDEVFMRTKKKDRQYFCDQAGAEVLILGSDWKGKKWEGEKLGLPIVYLPRTKEINSTFLRESI